MNKTTLVVLLLVGLLALSVEAKRHHKHHKNHHKHHHSVHTLQDEGHEEQDSDISDQTTDNDETEHHGDRKDQGDKHADKKGKHHKHGDRKDRGDHKDKNGDRKDRGDHKDKNGDRKDRGDHKDKHGDRKNRSDRHQGATELTVRDPLVSQSSLVVDGSHVFNSITAEFSPAPPTAGLSAEIRTTGTLCDTETLFGFEDKIIVAVRGGCTFVEKAANAELLGALGLIVVNTEDAALLMGGVADELSIPVVSVSQSDGAHLQDREIVTLSAPDTPSTESEDYEEYGEDYFDVFGELSQEMSHLSGTQIAFLCAGGAFVLVIFVALVVSCCRRRRRCCSSRRLLRHHELQPVDAPPAGLATPAMVMHYYPNTV